MVVCAKCKKEMRCIKTGMTVRYREEGEHAFAGDMFECPVCKATIAVTNSNSYYDEGAKRATDWDVWMDADKGFNPNQLRLLKLLKLNCLVWKKHTVIGINALNVVIVGCMVTLTIVQRVVCQLNQHTKKKHTLKMMCIRI